MNDVFQIILFSIHSHSFNLDYIPIIGTPPQFEYFVNT